MTQKELREALKRLGWTQATLSSRLRVSADAASKWCSGARPVPGYVEAYLRLHADFARYMEEVEAWIEKRPRKQQPH